MLRITKNLHGILIFLVALNISAQRPSNGFKDQRAEEDYSNLKDSTNLSWQNAIKYIALNNKRNSYLSLGGVIRPRFENITNQFWVPDNDVNRYSQRVTFHTDFHFGSHLRFFGELQHGYVSGGDTFIQTDDLDLNQGFVELKTASKSLVFRLGRQEMELGSGRLVDFGIGPNIRQTFDMAKVTFTHKKANVQAFYGKAVQRNFRSFDNEFNLFNQNATNSKLWGVYNQFAIFKNDGVDNNTELYYLGYKADQASFNDVMGEETRHSVGMRRFGTVGKRFTYNTELIYQFGEVGNSKISALNFETEWKYSFVSTPWRPTAGLNLDWATGDKNLGDGKINSFNPMFVDPAIYSLAVLNTPVNLLSLHPSIMIFPTRKLIVELEYALFYRSSKNDGLYSPPNRLIMMANGNTNKHIGNVAGLLAIYNFNKYINFTLRASYATAGDFIKTSGPSESIFQIAPTISITF